MKLFKNGVGRPSNETKELRRVFVVSVAAIIISLVALLVVGLSKSGILTSSLKGAATYKIQYDIASESSKDVTITKYPAYTSHTGTVKFPAAPSYTAKSGKKCSFRGWIFQKTDDGRYRMLTKSGTYVWYRSSLDSGKYSVQRYAYFGTGTTFRINSNVKLYASFSCTSSGSSSSSSSNTTTTAKVSNDKYSLVFLKNSNGATGSMSTQTATKTSTIKANTYSLENHTFAGWKAYRNISGSKKYFVKGKGWTGTSASAGTLISNKAALSSYGISTYTAGGNVIYLEAQWTENGGTSNYYTIVFYKNNSSATGSMSNQTIKKASNGGYNLKGNSFKRSGYEFVGWKAYRYIDGVKKYFVSGKGWTATSASSGTTIPNKADIQKNSGLNMDNWTSTGKYIYLEAQWKAAQWYISYRVDGTVKKYGWQDSNDYVLNVSKSGYTLKGYKAWRYVNNSKRWFVQGSGWTGTSANAGTLLSYSKKFKDISGFVNSTGYGNTIYFDAVWK